ncbi:hypothetical protein OPS25_06170 [Alteromonas ponticola]|uniref:Uncharacterized protein n=1 Tax=Alteromonas aquimaris TaxID=2998417 RepID=A0ABT3P5M5_9ALTE|nr:hypothetical protein [Alteromonas aquimaris]MCW8108078.1 hypothetical protein [Alteromonas aquimaris]
MKINSAAAPKDDNTNLNTGKSKPLHPPKKIERFLMLLIRKGSDGITQPEAFWDYRESCLHTSVSSLQKQHGITVARKPDKSTIVNYCQKAFNRYWLADDEQRKKAIILLNFFRSKRKADPLSFEPPSHPNAA